MSLIAVYVDDSQIILLSDGLVVNTETGKVVSLDKCKIHRLGHCAILHIGHLGCVGKILKTRNDYPDQVAKELSQAVRYFFGRRKESEKLYFLLIIGYNKKGEPEAWEITNLKLPGRRPHDLQKHDSIDRWLFMLPGNFGSAFEEKIDRFLNQGRNIPVALHLAFRSVIGEMKEAGKCVGGKVFLKTIHPNIKNNKHHGSI